MRLSLSSFGARCRHSVCLSIAFSAESFINVTHSSIIAVSCWPTVEPLFVCWPTQKQTICHRTHHDILSAVHFSIYSQSHFTQWTCSAKIDGNLLNNIYRRLHFNEFFSNFIDARRFFRPRPVNFSAKMAFTRYNFPRFTFPGVINLPMALWVSLWSLCISKTIDLRLKYANCKQNWFLWLQTSFLCLKTAFLCLKKNQRLLSLFPTRIEYAFSRNMN